MRLNICIVSRDEKKLKKVSSDLAEEFKIKTRAVVCDLGMVKSVAEYENLVVEKIKDLDIAMIFLNAGTSTPGTVCQISDRDIETQVRVNMLQPVYLTKALLPMLLKRNRKSAIVLTSSVVSWVATPGICIYSNTKAAVATFIEALHYETKGKIDVYSWDCGSVDTKLNTFPLGWRTSTKTAV